MDLPPHNDESQNSPAAVIFPFTVSEHDRAFASGSGRLRPARSARGRVLPRVRRNNPPIASDRVQRRGEVERTAQVARATRPLGARHHEVARRRARPDLRHERPRPARTSRRPASPSRVRSGPGVSGIDSAIMVPRTPDHPDASRRWAVVGPPRGEDASRALAHVRGMDGSRRGLE